MKRIVSITLGSSQRDYCFTTTILGQLFEIQRIGTNGNLARAAALVRDYEGRVDAIGLGGITPVFRVGEARYPHPEAIHIAAQSWHTPVVDGGTLKATLERWAIKCTADHIPSIFRYRRVLLMSGIDRYQLAQALVHYEAKVRFADPIIQSGLPFLPMIRTLKQLEHYAAMTLPLAALLPYRMLVPSLRNNETPDPRIEHLFTWADVIVGDFAAIRHFAPQNLEGRTIITDDPSPTEIEDLRQRKVTTLITMTPPLSKERPFVSTDVLEAIIVAMQQGSNPPDEASVLDFITTADWNPTIQQLNIPPKRPSFAFVIHPLSPHHIARGPNLGFIRLFPSRLVEMVAAPLPPVRLSYIRGIRSKATGEEVEGILFSLGATPRELLGRPPEFTYSRLLNAARRAQRLGAKIMGLGAFTSVVGDAGVTVARHSEIGITTGNSLTVAVTLEAAKRAVLRMGGRLDQGRAVVIGATGSIGTVCARLLALEVGNIVLIAPKPERLLELKQQIERETRGAQVVAATHPDAYTGQADLIVTATNVLHGKVLNIECLKPGAVICDVARPPNIAPEDAARRPDVLVIESGEVSVPGEPDFGIDMDLPPGTTYACLAETILLALEGEFGDYTLGRHIEIKRVEKIFGLMEKHGFELAGLRSFGRYLTDEDIAHKRQLADERRQLVALEHAF